MTVVGKDRYRGWYAASLVGANAPIFVASIWLNPPNDRPRYEPKGSLTLVMVTDVPCERCPEALARLKRLYERYRAQGLEIVIATQIRTAVDSGDGTTGDLATIRRVLIGQHGLTMPIAIDSIPGSPLSEPGRGERRVADYFATEMLPAFFVIDRAGVIRERLLDLDEDGLNRLIESLL